LAPRESWQHLKSEKLTLGLAAEKYNVTLAISGWR